MARIILSDILNDIRNSIGAHTYSIWKGVHYIRQKAASISNPNSIPQELVRSTVSTYSKQWTSVLTDTQRHGWNELAQSVGSAAKSNSAQGYKDIMPISRKVMSGYNMFLSCAVANARFGVPPVVDAPLGVDVVGQPTDVAVAPDGPPITKLTVTWVDPPNMGANDLIGIWVKTAKFAHAQLLNWIGIGVQTYGISQIRGAGGANIGIPIDLYRVQLCNYNDSGIRSAGSNLVTYNKVT